MQKQTKTGCVTVLIVSLLLLFGRSGFANPIHSSPAELLPENTLAYVEITNVSQLIEKAKKTSSYLFFKDPVMQPYIENLKERIQPKIDEFLKGMWEEIGLENPPENLPWPQGQIIVAVILQPRTITSAEHPEQFPNPSETPNESGPPASSILQEKTVPDFQVITLAQFGDHAEAVQQIISQGSDKMIEKGAFRQVESIDDIDFQIIKDNQEVDPDFDTLIYGFKDDLLIAGSSLKYVRQLMRKLNGSDDPSLARKQQNLAAIRTNKCPGELFVYFNAQTLLDTMKIADPDFQSDEAQRIMSLLGVDCLQGLAASASVAPNENQDLRITALLSIPQAKKGLFVMLAPKTKPVPLNPPFPANAYSIGIANYDIPTFYDQLMYLASAISKQNIPMVAQNMMAATGGDPQQSGQPPVDLRNELIANITGPVSFCYTTDPPYTMGNQKLTFRIAIRNREVLDRALSRIHATFIAAAQPDLHRVFLDTNLYLLPALFPMGPMAGAVPNADGQSISAQPRQIALAVTEDHLVIGPVDAVEQAIRDSRRDTAQTIAADPEYQYARRFLPDQTGMMTYTNTKINGEIAWNYFKELSQQMKNLNDTDNEKMTPENPEMFFNYILKEIFKYCDPSLLPDFELVKKYYGPAISYINDTDDGIYMDCIYLKPQP